MNSNASQDYQLNKEYRQRTENRAARNRQAQDARDNQRNRKSVNPIRIISQILISLK